MFKRLRERIAEEATKFPVGQLGNNTGRLFPESENKPTDGNSTEDLITLSDSSSVVVPHTSPQQFSIGEEEDGSLSEQSTPQKKQNASSDASGHYSSNSSGFDASFGQEYRPSKKSSYVPQSDIESEREDPPTLNLDSISKDQLMAAIQSLKAKSYKYKNKYAEVVNNYKELRDEKAKIENTLIENQDKGLRRIAELREQCQLEQKAKAHLEENLRLILDEKDSRICVLETQINLLKEGGKSNSTKTLPEDCDNQLSDGYSGDTRSEDSATSMSNDVSALQEKVDRLQHQINQDKKTITGQKDQISLLRKQNENLSQELEEKVQRLNSIEDEQSKLRSEHESVLRIMQDRLKELEKQQEDSVMSMAETKKNIHVELELREKQLKKAEEEAKQFQAAAEKEKELASELKKQYEQKVKQLQHQLEITEKTLEDEKQSLLHELGQGKTAAINLMQQECAKKIAAIEEEWKTKFETLQSSCENNSQSQVEDLKISLNKSEEKLKQNEQRIQELDSLVSVLEKENASLKNSVEKLESEIAQSSANYETLKVSYSDYDSLKEKENLLKMQETINRELNEKINKYLNTEKEIQSLCNSLTQQLDEKNTFIAYLEREKIWLIDKICEYETKQRDLSVACDNLKNEILSLKENLNNQINNIEIVTQESNNKSEEIAELQEVLKNVQIKEKLATEKLSMSLTEMRDFESENADLLQNNRLLIDEIANLKQALLSKEKELQLVSETFYKCEKEMKELNESLVKKEFILKHVVVSYEQVESFVTSLEKQQAYLKLVVGNLENNLKHILFKWSNESESKLLNIGTDVSVVNEITNNFESGTLLKDKVAYDFKDTQSVCSIGEETNLRSFQDKDTQSVCTISEETNLKSFQDKDTQSVCTFSEETNFKSFQDKDTQSICTISEETNLKSFQDKDTQSICTITEKTNLENFLKIDQDSASNQEILGCKKVLCNNTENANSTSQDMKAVFETLEQLKAENVSLKKKLCAAKTSAELQDVEFAKNITLLQQSLSDLQEERNNLSLVLQNIENTQIDNANSCVQNELKKEENRENEVDERYSWEIRISELNSKVKSEIEAVTLQTEVVNKELKGLHEQFKSNQDLYSEKVMELNSKLLFRTEMLLSLKEDLDSSLHNSECLKNLLEKVKQEVSEKDNLISLLEHDKKDFENKCKILKQDYFKRECELKATHNSQLVDLKDQTKLTIDKLNEQIKNLNQQVNKKEIEFNSKLSSMEKDYQAQICDLSSQLVSLSNCQLEINKFSELSCFLESKIFTSVEKLDLYCKKIISLNSKVNNFVLKLKEKDEKIVHLNGIVSNLQEEIKKYSGLQKDFNNIQNKLHSVSQLLNSSNNELEAEKSKVKVYETENSQLKTNFENATCQIQKLSLSSVSDKDKLQSLLDSLNHELEMLKKENSCLKTDFEKATQDIERLSAANVNDKDELQSLLNSTKDELKALKNTHSETLSNINLQNAQLKELQEKNVSTLNDLDNANKLLNEQKLHSDTLSCTICELTNKYNEIITTEIDNMSFNFKEHSEKCNALINQKEKKIEALQSKFLFISSNWKLKVQEISDLKSKLSDSVKKLEDNESLLKDEKENSMKSETAMIEWKLKYEKLIQETEVLSLSNKDVYLLLEKKEAELKEANLKLTSAEEEIEILKLEITKLQDIQGKLNIKMEDVQKCQNLLDNQNEKFTTVEKEKHELELKCNKYIDTLSIVEKEKDDLEVKYNEHSEKLITLEKQKEDLELKYNELSEKLITIEKQKENLELKCSEKINKLSIVENEKQDLNLKFHEQSEILAKIEKDKCELELKCNERNELELKCNEYIDKLTIVEKEKEDLEVKYNEHSEKLITLEKQKEDLELRYNEHAEKLIALEKQKENLELECTEQINKLSTVENEKQVLGLKLHEQAKILANMEKDKHELELKGNEKNETLEKEKQEWESKHNTLFKEVQNLKSEINSLLQSVSEKELAIKSKETEKECLETRHEESLKGMKDKLQNAEKNYKTQIEEMKLKINQLEKENSNLLSEKGSLLNIQNQFKELKSGEEKVQSELKSKEQELKLLKEKLDTSNKEQVEKLHTFQENVKDKENMILKLKANLESSSKEHKENIEELHKKIKRLEVEREQLMLQAQERVSATEAKCREDIKLLQEKCDKLQLGNTELEKSMRVAEINQAAASEEILHLKSELSNFEKKLAELEKTKLISESEFSNKLEKLQQENQLLLNNSDHVEKLKAEKEELNEKLKTAVQQVNEINILETERDHLRQTNEELSKELENLKTAVGSDKESSENTEKLTCENEGLKSEIISLQSSFKMEKDSFLLEKEKLLNQIQQLENCVSDPQNASVQDYLESIKKEYEAAIKAKDDDMLSKLKQLVKDFSIQMDVKDKDSEQMINDLIDKNQQLEERLQREYADLRQELFEKECALEEMRDSYEETLQEKDSKIKEQELLLRNMSSKDNTTETAHGTVEQSDWDDTWVVPDEAVDNSSPNHKSKNCDEHLQQIEALQEELSKSNSEIKELKILLRLSPPETMVNNNNRRDSLHSLPEPTEFEYLKNIIFEYMMGKEPVTLAKVIAAVLRFNDVQTQQVIRREEAKHPAK